MTAKTFAEFGIERSRASSGRFESEARHAAREAGMKRYTSGRACPAGHVGERFVSNCGCVQCLLEQSKRAHAERREVRNAKCRRYAKEHAAENRERSSAARYGSTRVPPWADRKAIQDFYRACPDGMVVDHIIPLQGDLVCGLHVLENLQYLTPLENAVKGAK